MSREAFILSNPFDLRQMIAAAQAAQTRQPANPLRFSKLNNARRGIELNSQNLQHLLDQPRRTPIRTDASGQTSEDTTSEVGPFRVKRKNGQLIVYDLPIVDEHDVYDEDGKYVTKCDKAMLEAIAANNNRRIKDTGDETPITVGHTVDDAPEDEQPDIAGYATGFYVAPLFDTDRFAIFVRQAKFPETMEGTLRKYPRRSVEIWFDDHPMVDPIALLGATTPERDLGLLKLSKTGKRIRCKSTMEPGPIRRAKEDWREETGQRGGKKWINIRTGATEYDQQNPGGIAEKRQEVVQEGQQSQQQEQQFAQPMQPQAGSTDLRADLRRRSMAKSLGAEFNFNKEVQEKIFSILDKAQDSRSAVLLTRKTARQAGLPFLKMRALERYVADSFAHYPRKLQEQVAARPQPVQNQPSPQQSSPVQQSPPPQRSALEPVLKRSKTAGHRIRRQKKEKTMSGAIPRDDDDLVGRIITALQETAEWQWIRQQMSLDQQSHEEMEPSGASGHHPVQHAATSSFDASGASGTHHVGQDTFSGASGMTSQSGSGGGHSGVLAGRDLEEASGASGHIRHAKEDHYDQDEMRMMKGGKDSAAVERFAGPTTKKPKSQPTVAAHKPEVEVSKAQYDKHGRPVRRAASGGTASGGNTYTPGEVSGSEADEFKHPSGSFKKPASGFMPKRGARKMSRVHHQESAPVDWEELDRQRRENETLKIRMTKIERDNEILIKNAKRAAFDKMVAQREQTLVQLEAEGFSFDRNEELEDAKTMNEEQWKHHVKKIRKRYSKAAGMSHWIPVSDDNAGPAAPPKALDKAGALAMAKTALANGANPTNGVYEDLLSGGKGGTEKVY